MACVYCGVPCSEAATEVFGPGNEACGDCARENGHDHEGLDTDEACRICPYVRREAAPLELILRPCTRCGAPTRWVREGDGSPGYCDACRSYVNGLEDIPLDPLTDEMDEGDDW